MEEGNSSGSVLRQLELLTESFLYVNWDRNWSGLKAWTSPAGDPKSAKLIRKQFAKDIKIQLKPFGLVL